MRPSTRLLMAALGCLLLLILAQQAHAIQRFDKQPQYTEVNPQGDAVLTCKVFNKRGSCSWQKDNKPVGMYERKYEWAGDQATGDCSLAIRSATLEFDDGEWECQVTASDFTTQDALTSAPVRLVVRVAPLTPRIEYNSSQVLPGYNLTARVGDKTNIKCISRLGNPPAVLKWFLGDEELFSGHTQTNATELDSPRTWVATSILKLSISKDMYARNLKCVAVHESYKTKSQEIDVRLDVRYPPEVRMHGAPTKDLEEEQDDVVLRCVADANPPATIMWRRSGHSDIASLDETLRFRPVSRRHSGTYTCQAKNELGTSEALSVDLDVKYPPQIIDIGRDRLMTAPLFTPVTFSCVAEANPGPTYQWLQKQTAPDGGILLRAAEARMHIANVTYDYQGEYVCKATNMIAGMERVAQSDAIAVQVVGAPQVLRHSGGREVVVSRGEDAVLQLVVCADPRPRRAAWEWGSQSLEAGKDSGRYQADELTQDDREDCYEAKLHVREVDSGDSRNYYLAVENEKGADRHAVHLEVREPVPMATLLSVAAGSVLVLLVVVLVTVYAVRREKCCFARRGDFRPSDLESEKSDVDSAAGRKTPAFGGVNIPSDAMYSTSPTYRPPLTITGSPDAMKRRYSGNYSKGTFRKERGTKDNVYADLQVPTMSNNGSTMMTMLSRSSRSPHEQQSDSYYHSPMRNAEYSYTTTSFQPSSLERAEI